MRGLRRVLAVCLAMALCLGAVGCADQTDEANTVIDKANAAIEKSNTLDAQMSELMAKVEQIDPMSKDAASAQPLLTDVQTKLEETKKIAESTLPMWDKISALDVDEELKTYAKQQKAIAQLHVDLSVAINEMVLKMKALYDPSQTSALTQAELDKLAGELEELAAKADAIDVQISEKQEAADKFFEEKGLGE